MILVRDETTPDDIHGMIAAQGILTVHGGMTSHAAVVARGMGKPCVAGCEGLAIAAGVAQLAGHKLREGDVITIDGGRARSILGKARARAAAAQRRLRDAARLGGRLRRLRVRANADTPEDAARAREFGAQGIGLCRTEHMFFGEERLPVMQEMILADKELGRRAALERLLPFQQSDFEGIFEAMAGLPVTIRLLDPPLARVPAARGAGDRRADAGADPLAARAEPDARHARLQARARLAGDLRDADPRDRARRAQRRAEARRGAARRDHASAGRLRGGASPPAGADRARLGGGGAGARPTRSAR